MSKTAFDKWWKKHGLPKEDTLNYGIHERNHRNAFNAGRKSMRDEKTNCEHNDCVLMSLTASGTMEWCCECGAAKKEAWGGWLQPKAGGVEWPK